MKLVPVGSIDANRALKEYIGDSDWMPKTGIGGMLTAASIVIACLDLQHLLFLPVSLAISAVLCGYILRNTRTRIKNPKARLPEWNDFVDLFMSGITWIMIQFCISIVVCMLVGTTLILAYYALISRGAYTVAIAEATFIAVTLIFFWVHFITTYLWVNFAVEERLSSGVALRKVTRYIQANPRAFWLSWALNAGLQLTAIVLPSITVIGLFVVPSTLFAAQLLGSNLLAQAWRSVAESEK